MSYIIQNSILIQKVITIEPVDVTSGGTFTLVDAKANIAYDIISVVSRITNQTLPYNGVGALDVLVQDQQFTSDFLVTGSSNNSGVKFMDYNAAQGGGLSSTANVILNTDIKTLIPPSTAGDGELTFYILYRELSF